MNDHISEEELSTENINLCINNFYANQLSARQEIILLAIAKIFPQFEEQDEHIFFDLLRALNNIYIDSLDDVIMYAQATNKYIDSAVNGFESESEANKLIITYAGPKIGEALRMIISPAVEGTNGS